MPVTIKPYVSYAVEMDGKSPSPKRFGENSPPRGHVQILQRTPIRTHGRVAAFRDEFRTSKHLGDWKHPPPTVAGNLLFFYFFSWLLSLRYWYSLSPWVNETLSDIYTCYICILTQRRCEYAWYVDRKVHVSSQSDKPTSVASSGGLLSNTRWYWMSQ